MTSAARPAAARWLGRPTLLRIGRLAIPSYAAMLYVGCVAGILAGSAVAGASGVDESRFVLAATLLLVPALVGARLWFVLQNAHQYRAAPRRIWRRREGGSALYGGLVLSVATSVPVLALAGVAFWRFWDAASISMLVGLVLTRFGCLMHGCCAGRPTCSRLGMWLPDHRGLWRHRFPTQLLEAAWASVVLIVALAARPAVNRPGVLFFAVVAAYAGARIALEPTREPAGQARIRRASVQLWIALLALAAFLLAGRLA